MTNLFTDRALQSLHQIGGRNGPITLLTPPLRATLALGVAIAVGGGIWATWARIPLTVQGVGVLLPVGAISTSISQTDGIAYWMVDQPASAWQQQSWQFKQNPGRFSDQAMATLARTILEASEKSLVNKDATATGASLTQFPNRGKRFPQGLLLIWVQNTSQKANLSSTLDQLERTLRASAVQEREIAAQQVQLRNEYNSRANYLANMKKLEARGYVSRDAILQQESTLHAIGSQIVSNDSQLIDLNRQRGQAYQALRNQLATVIEQQFIFAPRDVYLDQANALNGEAVTTGQALLKLSDQPLNDTVVVPVFVGSNETAQVKPGMTALATPAGYKRAEVGGIRASVVFKAGLPGNLETVAARVGVPSLAESILAQYPSPTLLMVALEKGKGKLAKNSGGYQWSSSSDLPFAPTPGQRLDVEITTRLVRPIDLVLPTLKQWFGLTPPNVPASAPRIAS